MYHLCCNNTGKAENRVLERNVPINGFKNIHVLQ